MTTINPQVYAVPEGASAGSLEQLAGVPSAAELSALANSLFPDLTKGAEYEGITPEPEVCADGIENLVENEDPAIFNVAENKAVTSYEHLFNEEGLSYGEYLNHAENSYGSDFDYAHPFGYGGSSTDEWLNVVDSVSDPTRSNLSGIEDPKSVIKPNTKSYSPSVMS